MFTKKAILTGKTSLKLIILGLLLLTMGNKNLSPVHAQKAYSSVGVSSSYIVDYLATESDQLTPEAKDAIALALTNWPYEPPKSGRLSILSLRWESNWALATVASADLISPKIIGQETSVYDGRLVPLVLVRSDNKWKAAVRGDQTVASLLDLIPDSEFAAKAKDALFIEADISSSQAYNNYKFPWASGKPWRNHGGWHGLDNRALDFGPVDNINSDILAAAPGYVTALAECSPSDHYIINITTENTSEYLGYTHLTGASVRAEGIKLGDYIPQGKKLGVMAGAFSGSDSCNISSTGMHLHLLMAMRPFTINGLTYSDSNWHNGEDLYSTQNIVPTIFSDVPATYWAWSYIERLYNAGITGGCNVNPLLYCPATGVTRSQMAVFLLRAEHGSAYTPPDVGGSTGFTDVPTTYWAAAWIKQLALEGITVGCGPNLFCPETLVSRDQMAVFLLRGEHGASYVPPAVGAGTGFTDVPTTHWAAAWIKQLAAEGITGGCTATTYCPTVTVTRDQMAVFLVRTFNLP